MTGVYESYARSRDAVVNREQKIALIVGFAVVLVVGVLISDHLSGARHLQLADATEGDAGRVEAAPIAYLPDRMAESRQLAADEPVVSGRVPAVQPMIGGRETQAEPYVFAQGGRGEVSPLGKVLDTLPVTKAEDDTASDSWQDSVRNFGERIARGLDNGVREAVVIDRPVRQPARPVSSANAVRPVEVQPVVAPVRHVVKKNESLYKIAKSYLGNGNRWREIAAANAGRVGADGSVRSGVTLVIPGTVAEDTGRKSPSRTPKTAPATARSGPVKYTVKKNDSLSEIAQRYLGTTRRMPEIIAANRGKIDDPDDIRVGMVLTIPAKS